MGNSLSVAVGQYSHKGAKPVNQDFHATTIPEQPLLASKGVIVAIADGISSSEVSQIASETAIKGLMSDYYSTPESWSVKTSVQRIIHATNSWLYSQSRSGPHRFNLDKGYVCTLTTLVLKSNTAHLFHIGDTRAYRISRHSMEQLTSDHRLHISPDKSYLSRAMGMREHVKIDYRSLPLEVDDIYVLASDGVYETLSENVIRQTIEQHIDDLDKAAQLIVSDAIHQGADDNLTIQIIHIKALPTHALEELGQHTYSLPFPPELQPRMEFDGYTIVRELHNSSRSHVYLAVDMQSGKKVIIKVPATEMRNERDKLERFVAEEWVARQLNSPHLVQPHASQQRRNYLYSVFEYIDGISLAQWLRDNPRPDTETVRTIIEQLSRGLLAMHRKEILHQDLRPENILIDKHGTVTIIDFGSVSLPGLDETLPGRATQILGTLPYTAPEYFLGEAGTTRSDLFSLAVITYHMLSGRLPYGNSVSTATTRSAQRKLVYSPVLDDNRTIPAWIDDALRKALHPNPAARYEEISEFIHDLRQPGRSARNKGVPPLIERHPIRFWKGVSLLLFIALILLGVHAQGS